jgi:hypothetical protein
MEDEERGKISLLEPKKGPPWRIILEPGETGLNIKLDPPGVMTHIEMMGILFAGLQCIFGANFSHPRKLEEPPPREPRRRRRQQEDDGLPQGVCGNCGSTTHTTATCNL